jgi:predicted RNA binding protein YcfA (HicA-like mRNA interferase family)
VKEYGKAVRDLLEKHGCYFVRHGKGDHDIWHSPISKRNVTVDGKIYIRHAANGVLKEAGIKHRFR